jgi:hypothetical protein
LNPIEITNNVIKDSACGVWVATSYDITGLALENDDLDILVNRIHHIVPELISGNGLSGSNFARADITSQQLTPITQIRSRIKAATH